MSTIKKRNRSGPEHKKFNKIVSFAASKEDIQAMNNLTQKLNLTRGELLRKSFYYFLTQEAKA